MLRFLPILILGVCVAHYYKPINEWLPREPAVERVRPAPGAVEPGDEVVRTNVPAPAPERAPPRRAKAKRVPGPRPAWATPTTWTPGTSAGSSHTRIVRGGPRSSTIQSTAPRSRGCGN